MTRDELLAKSFGILYDQYDWEAFNKATESLAAYEAMMRKLVNVTMSTKEQNFTNYKYNKLRRAIHAQKVKAKKARK